MSHVTQKFKLPGEVLSIPIEFSDALNVGESIVSVASTALDKSDGADVTSTVIVGTTFSGSVVTVRYRVGTKGQHLQVDVLATTDLSASPPETIGHRIDLEIE